MDKSIFKFIYRHTKAQQLYIPLDIPKLIVNNALSADDPAIDGDEFPRPLKILGIELFDMGQIWLLLTLCILFLLLVFVNGGFKMYINIYKGRLGERMLRRLRYMLYARILRFPLPHFRKVSQGELIPMITAEVEPLGGFIGDAFALPALQGGLLATAIFFIFLQDPLMGAAAIALYPIQGYIIPKLQRRVNALGKARVRAVRRLSDRVGESVAGIQEVHAHDTAQYELSDFSQRLSEIFEIRYQIYNKKFFIKFLNNFLAQLTPFFFFTIGGILVIEGDLTLGSLVAILAAYKDLAPPWKELLTFYQIKEDSRIKYEQVIVQFEPQGILDEEKQEAEPTVTKLEGELAVANVTLQDEDQVSIVSGLSFKLPLDERVAVVGSAGSGKEELMLMLARLIEPTSGRLTAGTVDLGSLPESVTGRRLGFVAQNAYVFAVSLKDNLYYGLKHRPMGDPMLPEEEASARSSWVAESERSGNSTNDIFADWVDYQAAGASGPEDAIAVALKAIELADMSEDVYQLGLRGSLDPAARPEAAEQILEVRRALAQRLKEPEYSALVEAFDPEAYNNNATLAENLIFGTPSDQSFDLDSLAENEYVLRVLEESGLTQDLVSRGHQLAATMIELFADLPPDHELFQRFSFISADDLPDYQALLAQIDKEKLDELGDEDRTRLLSLPFKLIPARHRLGLIDDDVQAKILAARKYFLENLPEELKDAVGFFDSEAYNAAATVQDNVLFGKVAYGQAQAAEKIGQLISDVIDARGLRSIVMEVGLDYEAGIAGTRLSGAQRQKLAIARSIVKAPDVLIVSEATAALESASQNRILDNILQAFEGRGVIWSLHRAKLAERFDRVLVMKNGRVVEQGKYDELDREGSVFRELVANG
jgi:ABC-type multidrug transport system fused ATPase/permease subunit